MTLKLRELDLYQFKRIYREHLVKDFPLLERKPFYFIFKMYERKKYSFYLIEEGGRMKGYASFMWKNEDVVLLDYFATVSTERGSGIGSKMLNMLASELKGKLILFECESPDTAKTEEDRLIRERRIDFYRKNGAYLTGIESTMAGVKYKILSLDSKNGRINIKNELNTIYRNMFPEFIFRRITAVLE